MWIRSQDRKKIIKCEDIEISGTDIVNITRYGVAKLGKYSIEEKALKVLDMIEQSVSGFLDEKVAQFYNYGIFQMPTDEEV